LKLAEILWNTSFFVVLPLLNKPLCSFQQQMSRFTCRSSHLSRFKFVDDDDDDPI
jgi:hypothetical protein